MGAFVPRLHAEFGRRVIAEDYLCDLIREGHIAVIDRQTESDPDRAWARQRVAVRAGEPLVLTAHAVARAMAQQGMQRRAQQWLKHHNPGQWFLVPAVGRMVESDREGHPLRASTPR